MNAGIAICHYNRTAHLAEIIEAVQRTTPHGSRIIVCDDGSRNQNEVRAICERAGVESVLASNQGVTANKNRALSMLSDWHYLCLLEDDIMPVKPGWFENYFRVASQFDINHFSWVFDRFSKSLDPNRDAQIKRATGLTVKYSRHLGGQVTFLTTKVLRTVGGFNPAFRGCGFGHIEWSKRIWKAGLIAHPNRWIDLVECEWRPIGDREGGRLDESDRTAAEIKHNGEIFDRLLLDPRRPLYCPVVFLE